MVKYVPAQVNHILVCGVGLAITRYTVQRISVGKKMGTNDLLNGEIMVSQRWVTENRKVSKSILETSAVLNTTQLMPAVTQANTHATKHTHEAQDTLIRLMT